MIQIYNDNIKRPKPQDIPLEILKIYAFYWKIQQERVLLELRISPFENTTNNLVVQGRV